MKNMFVIINNKMFDKIKSKPNSMIQELFAWDMLVVVAEGISIPASAQTTHIADVTTRIVSKHHTL